MKTELQILIALIIFGLSGENAGAATITFDKVLDVPDRDFTVTYDNSTFSFTIADIGNYKFGNTVGVTVSGGANNMKLVLFTINTTTPWQSVPFYNSNGYISTTIPADRFDPNCLDPAGCDDGAGGYKVGRGIYALAVQNRDGEAPYQYFIAKPLIMSDYDLTVTPNATQTGPGNTIKVTVNVSKNGIPVSVTPDNVKVEFVQTSTHFNGTAEATATTGVYEANIQVPSTASGSYNLYAAITTDRNIYQDYPEIIGAAGFSGLITIPAPTQTQAQSSGGGGGGGGGGGPSGEEFKNIESKEAYEKYIAKDVSTSYVFRQAANPVSEVTITGNNNAGDIAVKTELLRGTSSLVSSPPPGLVYKNINIWVGTAGFANPKNIKEAIIEFRIENSWLENNKLAGSEVRMVRWDGSRWNELETAEKTKNNTYTYFEAKTQSFSSFAIVGKITEKATPVETKPAATITVTQTTAAQELPVKETPAFEAISGVIALLIMVLKFRK